MSNCPECNKAMGLHDLFVAGLCPSCAGKYITQQTQRIKVLEAVFDHPNHDDPKQRYLYEIRCAIKLLRENGSEYAFGVAVQLDQFYKRTREALKGE